MAIIANIFIDQGTDFSITVDVTDSTGDALNMSGYTASATFGTSIAENSGQVTLTLSDSQTTALESGRYVYDMNITSGGGQTTRVVEGQAIVTPGVTR